MSCIQDNSENEEIDTQNVKIYTGEKIFKQNEITILETLIKDFKEIDLLSLKSRKELSKKLLEEGNEESIKRALEYDNTSYDIILKNYKFQKNDELLSLFYQNMSKIKFEILILDILNSDKWDESILYKKFVEYNKELDSRIKFNQLIDTDNKALFFYYSKIHILSHLLKNNDFSQFKRRLNKKRNVYKKIKIAKFIKNNRYPQESNKLKLFMIILILIDSDYFANYMIRSIIDEKNTTEYYYKKIIKLKLVDEKNLSYNDNSLLIEDIPFNKNKYSFKAIIFYLKNNSFKKDLLNNELLYKYEYFLSNFWINEYLSEFKEIIKMIFKSQYYATIISKLLEKKEKEIKFIQNDGFIDYLISKINFIPINKRKVPFLDKFSLDIFLGGYGSEFINFIGLNEYEYEHIEKITTILKLTKYIIHILQESGYFIYSYFSIISNNYYNFNSPNIRINYELNPNKSGEHLELLLFGRIIENLNLKEALFLLNAKNHKNYNNFDEYRDNFINSDVKKYEDLVKNFEGPFFKLIKEIDWKEIEDNKRFPFSITTKNKTKGQPYIVLIRNKDDALGKYFEE